MRERVACGRCCIGGRQETGSAIDVKPSSGTICDLREALACAFAASRQPKRVLKVRVTCGICMGHRGS